MKEFLKKCLPTYEIVEKIGEGIHGSVYKVKDMLKERAVKIVPIQVERSRLYMTETELDTKVSQDFHAVREYYEKIRGEGVVQIFDFHLVDRKISKNQAQATLVVLMELCPFTLHEYILDIFPLNKNAAMRYMKELVSVLARISVNNDQIFLLTDFKPSNFLITADDRLVIGDLGGLKRISSVSTIANAQFTPNWSAPELILKGERPTMRSAIYSFGLVCYFIWEAGLPYEDKDFADRLNSIKDNGISFDHFNIPESVKALITQCLAFEPYNRPKNFVEIEQVFTKLFNENKNDKTEVADLSVTADFNEYSASDTIKSDKTITVKPFKKSPGIFVEELTRMEFVWVEGGAYVHGDLSADSGKSLTEVDGFWIGRYPVTQWQWKKITNKIPSHFHNSFDHPVEQIAWKEAVSFCSRLTSINNNGWVFRLPTELQWEYAARSGGKNEKFAGGSELADFAWYKGNSDMTTHAVGRKLPNGLGLYDMCGNIQELCEDHLNPGGWEKIVRGGAWNLSPEQCQTIAKRKLSAELRYSNTGLRLVAVHQA